MRYLAVWLLPPLGLLGLLALSDARFGAWGFSPPTGGRGSAEPNAWRTANSEWRMEGEPKPFVSRTPMPQSNAAGQLLIVFSSEINGYLTPCGCSKPMVGGIPRRATLLKQLARTYNLLKLENGDLTKAGGRQDELKAETLIEMLNLMGYDALNLGEYDFKLGLAYLQALQQRFQGKILCGNVADGSGKPLFDAFTLIEKSHNGRKVKVLVAGLLSEQHADAIRQRNPDLQVLPALQRLDALREQLSTVGELRILLWHGSQQEAEQIARQHPYFDLIVYAHSGDGPLPPKQVGKTRLVFSGNDAKFVGLAYLEGEAPAEPIAGQVANNEGRKGSEAPTSPGSVASTPRRKRTPVLSPAPSRLEQGDALTPVSSPTLRAEAAKAPALLAITRIDHIRLTEDYKDDPDTIQIKLGYLARVDAEGLLLQVVRRPTLNGDTFAGSRACRSCHLEDYRIWERSKHAKALQTLIDEKHDKDPECVVCHVVGLEYESGFVSMDKTPQLKDVGCESCHGPARKHVQDPQNNRLGKAGEQSCMQCHVPAHSPGFDFQTYWKQIEHGQSLREGK